VQATFDDQGVYLAYESLNQPTSDSTLLVNSATVTNAGGVAQTSTDAGSAARYWTRPKVLTGLLAQTDTEALNYAAWLVYLSKNPEYRVDSMNLELGPGASASEWAHVLGRKLSDRVRVIRHPYSGTTFDKQMFVEGIDHTVTKTLWRTTNWFSSATYQTGMFVFDSATLGKLDTNTLGGY